MKLIQIKSSVQVLAIGVKERNRLIIGKEEFDHENRPVGRRKGPAEHISGAVRNGKLSSPATGKRWPSW